MATVSDLISGVSNINSETWGFVKTRRQSIPRMDLYPYPFQ